MSFEVPDDIFAMFQAASNCIFGLKLKTALHNHRESVCVLGGGVALSPYEPVHEISNNVAFNKCRLRRDCAASF